MRDAFHFVGNVTTVEMEQAFLLSGSRFGGTCANFLELFTQCPRLLLEGAISFRKSVRRKRRCVLTTVSQPGVREAAEPLCVCRSVRNWTRQRECVCWSEMRLQGEFWPRGGERVGSYSNVGENASSGQYEDLPWGSQIWGW